MSELIDMQNISLKAAEMVEEGRVHKDLYSDPAIFEEELGQGVQQHLGLCWPTRAKLPEAGSFKTSYIGRQRVILSRDRKMNLHVLQNRCRHRGATVCEARKGQDQGVHLPLSRLGAMVLTVACARCPSRKSTTACSTRMSCRWKACGWKPYQGHGICYL